MSEHGLLRAGHRALDLGTRTGQATGPLLTAGQLGGAVIEHYGSGLVILSPTETRAAPRTG